MFGRSDWGASQAIRNQLVGRPAGNAFGGGFTNQLPRQQPPLSNGGAMQGGGMMGTQMPPQQMPLTGGMTQQAPGAMPMTNAGVAGGNALSGPLVNRPMPVQNSPMAPMPAGLAGGGQFSPMAPAQQPPQQASPLFRGGVPPQQYSPMAPAQRPPMGLFGFRGS